jgi:UPF0755 protein
MALLGIAGALALCVAILGFSVSQFLHREMSLPDQGVVFEVAAGSAFANVSRDLATLGYIDHPDWFRWYARLTDRAAAVQAGEYRIEPGTTPVQFLEKMVSGAVQLYSFTIIEGWTFRELLAAIDANDRIELGISFEDWPALLQSLAADAGHPEGLFLPETYRFPAGTTGTDLLRQAHTLLKETLAEEWHGRAVGLPLNTPYEALILASIVEKETALAAERPQISGVFIRRLEQGMLLQTDPTVIYGLGADFDGNLTRRNLRTDTPYNTYTRKGLPPTPIALPGRAAIHAAMHPAPGAALFFVATGQGDGSHKFSATKEEHDIAVREYLQRQRGSRNARRDQQE